MRNFVKITTVFILLFHLSACQMHKQERKKKVISMKDRISELLRTSKKAPFIKAKKVLQEAIFLSKKLGNDSLHFKSISRLSVLEYRNKNYLQFKNQSSELLKVAFEKKDTLYLAKGYFNLGSYYNKISQVDTAYYYYNEAKRYYQSLYDSTKVGSSLLNMSILQIDKGDYYGSESTTEDALSYVNKNSNVKTTRSLYNNFGIISYELKHYKDGLHWYEKGLELTKTPKIQAIILNNIGIIYRDMGDYMNATQYFEKGLAIDLKKEEHTYAMLLDNLGYVHFLKKKPNALQIMLKALVIRNRIKNHRGQIVSKLHLGNYYLYKKDTIKAFEFLTSAFKKAKKIKDAKNLLKILKVLSKNSANTKYHLAYEKLKDSIHFSERNYKHLFAKIRYRTEQKENEYDVLQTQFNKQTTNLKQQQERKIQYALLFGVACILLVIGFYFFNQRKKIHKQQLIIEKLKARAEEKQDISVHLHDAVAGDILLGLQQSEKLQQKIQHPEFTSLISIFERAYEKARKISQDLSQLYFQKIPFTQKITNLCVEYSFDNDIKVMHSGVTTIGWEILLPEIKIAVFGILQEALNNVLKHAEASEVIFTFYKKERTIVITIGDNGVGTDLDTGNKGIGILNMQKRVADLKGTITFNNNKPKGTLIRVEIPMLYKDA
jgi:signal transduction histidine kinase/tetratricopeptide (TPR) repeat protein